MAMFRKEELLRLSNKKFHNDDVKSVWKWSEALIGQWRSYIVLFITSIQITDKRQKALGIFPSSGRSTNENNTARDHCKVSFPSYAFSLVVKGGLYAVITIIILQEALGL